MSTIQEEWDKLAAHIFSCTTPEIQKSEMKKAFFAGATAVFAQLIRISDLDEEVAAAHMSSMSDELAAFFEPMAKAHAETVNTEQ